MVALVQGQDYEHWTLDFSSHFVRHAATCHTSDNSKIIQKAVKDSVRLHAASVSSFLTLTSLTAVFACFSRGDGYSMLQQCRLDVFGEWSKLPIDFSLASVVPPSFAACLLAMNRHGLPWPASRQGIGPSSCTTWSCSCLNINHGDTGIKWHKWFNLVVLFQIVIPQCHKAIVMCIRMSARHGRWVIGNLQESVNLCDIARFC